jgi:subtilisin family serine protease
LDYETTFDMPDAPAPPARRGFGSEMNIQNIIRNGTAFALFVASILLVVWAVGLLETGLLDPYPPELAQRHEEFKQLSGFDNVSTSGEGVDVCIVDTGIDLSHPDLAHLQLAGWQDFVSSRSDPYDDQGHGTAMAGILVAKNRLPGIAPNVDLHIAKAISKSGSGTDTNIAAAVDWCVDSDVDIISLSLGGGQGIDWIFIETDELEEAVDNAINQGIFVVAAAGNDGGPDDDGDVASPGSVEDVICVGAIDTDGSVWSNSSIGDNGMRFPEHIFPRQNPDKKPEIVAPGQKLAILNAQIDTDILYAWGSGTSGATVWVSGAIAHLLEDRPDLRHNGSSGGSRNTVEDVKVWIQNSVVPKDGQAEHDNYYGYGRLRVDALLTMGS